MGPAPRLYSWGARALYLGPALGLTPHRNAVAVVALGIDAPFGVANDPSDPNGGYRPCRSVLIPPNTLHHLADTRGRMAFLYFDARSRDLNFVAQTARLQTARAGFDLRIEAELIDCIDRLSGDPTTWKEARANIAGLLSPAPIRDIDPRVKRALRTMHDEPGDRPSLARIADEVGLSQSRFLHLFKGQLGVPFRRYKLWIAMGAAMRAVGGGQSLTAAALDAGFSSSAHFSASFREMFGLEPSRLVRGAFEAPPDAGA